MLTGDVRNALRKSMELLLRTSSPCLYLALATTEPKEKATRHTLMQQHGLCERDAAIRMTQQIDQARGTEPLHFDLPGEAPCSNG